MIGDIVEQYQRGRAPTWYRRQVAATVVIGLTTYLRTHSRRVLRAVVLAVALPWLLALAGWSVVRNGSNSAAIGVLFNVFVFGYCSVGCGLLLLTITRSDEPSSLHVVDGTPFNAGTRG